MTVPFIEDNDQTQARHAHLESLRELVGNVYPNKFERSNVAGNASGEDTITSVVEKFKEFEPKPTEGEKPAPESLESANSELNKIHVRIAGRLAAPPRVMGKAAFVHLSDGTSRLQIYVRKADVSAVNNDTHGVIEAEGKGWELFGLLDHGDFIGVEGYLFVTKTGELSVHAEKLQFLAKALLPMPDKMHGIQDAEIRQRQRYADLIAGSLKLEREENDLTPREVFELRSRVVREIRRFLDDRDFVEVETPMLTPLATGAAARPFKTHHNALDIDLYARIAPELYLKRLVVGGFEKVYELNRNFRNEGISTRHNPEFTMLEFYMAYADVNQMMDLCEKLLRSVVLSVKGTYIVPYLNLTRIPSGEVRPLYHIDFEKPFKRMTMIEAIEKYWFKDTKNEYLSELELEGETLSSAWLKDAQKIRLLFMFVSNRQRYRESAAARLRDEGHLTVNDFEEFEMDDLDSKKEELVNRQSWLFAMSEWSQSSRSTSAQETGTSLAYLFESLAEPHLIQPTFITDFPKPISPLSKASPSNPAVAERFEYFVGALESANGFSELNDPEEQYQRFNDQVKQRERGDEEAMVMDEDYIRALSYGMPPAAGIGIGIDRLVMLLANKQSIRDVILFPHLRPERRGGEQGE